MTRTNLAVFPTSVASAKLHSLSRREHEALSLAAMGLADKEIAQEMGCSYNTARAFLRNIAMKLGTGSRTEAAMLLMSQPERKAA